MNEVIWFWVFVAVCMKAVFAASKDPVVKTSYGSVKGHHVKSYGGRIVTAFEGIPYAQPPVGELRFKEPQPPKPWNKTLDANKKYTCMQFMSLIRAGGVTGDEDCLYLYIYVPKAEIKGNENLDVVIHMHAGAFSYGNPHDWAGYAYIMDRDVIYVNLNYRLGILGFLSTQDEVLPGNNGLKDQVQAMKWIKENIRSFGGNPNSITLTGLSAGSASVHLHYLSPLSSGLFNRGLAHSGTALNIFSLAKTPLRTAKKLGAHFNCSTESSKEMIKCLKGKPVRDVVAAQRNFFTFINVLPTIPFGPVIELGNPSAFLPDHPYKLLSQGRINDCPLVFSNTKDEGVAPVGFVFLYNKVQELDQRWEELAPSILEFNDTANDEDKTPIAKSIRNHYFRNESLSTNNGKDLVRLFTDRVYYVDGVKAITLHAQVSRYPVYYYLFEYYINSPVFYKGNLTAVAHAEDCRLLYKQADNPPVLPDSDRRMKDVFIDFLYSYASKGIPMFNRNTWTPLYSSVDQTSYMHIFSPDTIRRERALNLEPLAFWQKIPLWENENVLPYFVTPSQDFLLATPSQDFLKATPSQDFLKVPGVPDDGNFTTVIQTQYQTYQSRPGRINKTTKLFSQPFDSIEYLF